LTDTTRGKIEGVRKTEQPMALCQGGVFNVPIKKKKGFILQKGCWELGKTGLSGRQPGEREKTRHGSNSPKASREPLGKTPRGGEKNERPKIFLCENDHSGDGCASRGTQKVREPGRTATGNYANRYRVLQSGITCTILGDAPKKITTPEEHSQTVEEGKCGL